MTYRTIVVHVEESAQLQQIAELAGRIAIHEQAHLIGIATSKVVPALEDFLLSANDAAVREKRAESQRLAARQRLTVFGSIVRQLGLSSVEAQLNEQDFFAGDGSPGPCADLIVIGRDNTIEPSIVKNVDFPEYLILNGACPVLMIPDAERVFTIGDRPLIAWDGSLAAMRAVRDALPFLVNAKRVHIIIGNEKVSPRRSHSDGRDLARYLATHDVNSEIIQIDIADNAGFDILRLAAELTSDLIVAGCVAHLRTRTRSEMLGGTTCVLLEHSTVPLLMSH